MLSRRAPPAPSRATCLPVRFANSPSTPGAGPRAGRLNECVPFPPARRARFRAPTPSRRVRVRRSRVVPLVARLERERSLALASREPSDRGGSLRVDLVGGVGERGLAVVQRAPAATETGEGDGRGEGRRVSVGSTGGEKNGGPAGGGEGERGGIAPPRSRGIAVEARDASFGIGSARGRRGSRAIAPRRRLKKRARRRAARVPDGAPHAPVQHDVGLRPVDGVVDPSAGLLHAEPAPLSLRYRRGGRGEGVSIGGEGVPLRAFAARRRRFENVCGPERNRACAAKRRRDRRTALGAGGEAGRSRATHLGEKATLGQELGDVRGEDDVPDARRGASEGRLGRTSARVLSRLGAGKGSQAISARDRETRPARARRVARVSDIDAKRRRGPRSIDIGSRARGGAAIEARIERRPGGGETPGEEVRARSTKFERAPKSRHPRAARTSRARVARAPVLVDVVVVLLGVLNLRHVG